MRTRMTGAERRQWVDKLLEQYTTFVWTYLTDHCESVQQAEDAFVYVFVQASDRLGTRAAREVTDDWMLALLKEAVDANPPHIAWEELVGEDERGDAIPRELGAELANDGTVRVPGALIRRSAQLMRAHIARDEAMRHHRGPLGTKIGAVAVVIVGVAGVGYGLSDRWTNQLQERPAVSAKSSKTANPSPHIGGDLPVSAVAMYQVSPSDNLDVTHLAVDSHAVYQGTLVLAADSWPRIDVSRHPFSTSNQKFGASGSASYAMELVPPLQANNQVSTSSWQISEWQIEVMGNWIIGLVTWNDGRASDTDVEQIYALCTTNGKYSLVRTLAPEKGVENRFAVAVGDGKIIVQPGLDDGTGAAPLGLPIQIYTLRGTDPTRAWTELSQIPASFGLMESPVATGDGIVFQGIVGKADTSSDNVDTWYQLTWSGTLNRYDGPPVDGQMHWAVEGASGTPWWVETTPDASENHRGYQVSMAQLANDKSASPTKNLQNSVLQLTVDGSDLIWIQAEEKGDETLVVAQVES
ncbi:hypothetical protein [Alicyclobacillus fastidiosus]|uniref:Uncharacterized protein n=1 Tax=Alicyclobacillus fastidiosus TaxID=392011 RepID=A0ABV5AFP8_9BACL|nr:hypothetical protein [Alicyclobacillus fastidiosus]WEH11634.1 hypothetical protein PYS47_10720 [Alicyclobacillus fastidiosus]